MSFRYGAHMRNIVILALSILISACWSEQAPSTTPDVNEVAEQAEEAGMSQYAEALKLRAEKESTDEVSESKDLEK